MTVKLSDAIAIVVVMAVLGLAAVLAISNSNLRTDLAELRAAQVGIVSANREWEAATLGLQSSLAQCQGQWATAQADADAAVALADEFRKETVLQQQRFDKRWAARTMDCRASLDQMQAACSAEIGDY